jgi:ribosomal protein S26
LFFIYCDSCQQYIPDDKIINTMYRKEKGLMLKITVGIVASVEGKEE